MEDMVESRSYWTETWVSGEPILFTVSVNVARLDIAELRIRN